MKSTSLTQEQIPLERFRKSCSGVPRLSPLAKGGKRGVARYANTENALALTGSFGG